MQHSRKWDMQDKKVDMLQHSNAHLAYFELHTECLWL